MSSRQVRRAAERAARKQARKANQQASTSSTTSETRAAMNRVNAQHSTGPKTAEGRANSSRNSFKHGLYSKQLVLSTEDAAALDALKADLRAEHRPANTAEDILVNELAEQFWRLRRARAAEVTVLETEGRLSQLAAVHRMMSSAERGFHKALTTLRQLQKDRGAQDAENAAPPAHIGFVSQNAPAGPVESEHVGFVPPDCPADVDPWEWARVHDPEGHALYQQDEAVLDALISRGEPATSQFA